MSHSVRHNSTYSVFVGHIPPNTKKNELWDLFKGCGEIMDVVIIEGRDTYNYGFVRYAEKDSAFRAISELNHWSLSGKNIVVDIEKNTAEKIQQEQGAVNDVRARRRNVPRPGSEKSLGTDYITDTMYWTRLQESCTAVNLRQSNGNHLSIKKLADEINCVKAEKTTLFGSAYDASISFSEISRKIMQKCRKNAEEGEALGKKNSTEFMCALRTIMKEINEVLDTKTDSSVECIKDKDQHDTEMMKLEGDLIKEVNEELEVESDFAKLELENPERSAFKTKSKRLSDVSVQTLDNSDFKEVSDRNSEDNMLKFSDADSDVTDHVTGHVTNNQSSFYLPTSGSHTESDNDFPYLDPAIVDYHMSKHKEMDESKKRCSHGELNERERNSEKDNFFKLLRSKVSVEDGVREFVRSKSRESSLSEDSIEGNIDDSGVESDCLGISKGRRSLGVVENMLGVNRGYDDNGAVSADIPDVGKRNRYLKGSASDPSLGMFNIDPFMMKGIGRGRGLFSAELDSKAAKQQSYHDVKGIYVRSISTEEGGNGQRMLGAGYSLKLPLGRGHHT